MTPDNFEKALGLIGYLGILWFIYGWLRLSYAERANKRMEYRYSLGEILRDRTSSYDQEGD